MTTDEVKEQLRRHPTQSVPWTGEVLAGMSRQGSYLAAQRGELGVPVISVGGRRRVSSVAIMRALGLDDEKAA